MKVAGLVPDSEVHSELGLLVDDLPGWDDISLKKDIVHLLLQELAVGHLLFRRCVLNDITVGAVEIDAQVFFSFTMKELQTDEMVCPRVVRDWLDC